MEEFTRPRWYRVFPGRARCAGGGEAAQLRVFREWGVASPVR